MRNEKDPCACIHAELITAAGCWLLAALFLSETGLLQRLPPVFLPVLVLGPVAAAVIAYWKLEAFRCWADNLPFRPIAGFHLVRFIGVYFLILEQRGLLPSEFAISAGWGDIVIATGAAGLLFLDERLPSRRRLVLIWNAAGLGEILFVVSTGARLAITRPGSMQSLTELPLSLLPTLIVPLVIASHLLLFRRLLRRIVCCGPINEQG